MDEVTIRRAEAIIDFGAAAALSAAVAWLCVQLAYGLGAAAVGLLALATGFAALRQVRPEAIAFSLGEFHPRDLEAAELVLTQSDRAQPTAMGDDLGPQELVLDDALAPPPPDARVVRLFDASAMQTPSQLKSPIERHLAGPQLAPPDASQALFDALADLRSSLR